MIGFTPIGTTSGRRFDTSELNVSIIQNNLLSQIVILS